MPDVQAIYNPSLDTTIDVYCGRANNNTLIGTMSLASIYNTIKADNPTMKGLVIGGKKNKTGYQDFTLLFPVAGTAYHIGDSNLNGSTSGTMYWVFFEETSSPSNKRYFYEADGTLVNATVSFSKETIDSITYYKNDFYRADSVPPIFIIESDIVPLYINGESVTTITTSNGGGATHIAKVTGQLKDLSSNLPDILIVSGGGGGGLLVDDTDYLGKEAGGISGSGDNSADQSTGNAFGQGESGTNVSGGGSGLYGGYKGTSAKSGGAGSGYIGNSLLSNKKMVGYNVPTSSAEGTKTESVNDVSASAVSGKPKSGNGFARIKFLREVAQFRSIDLPLANRIVPAKFKPEYSYYYGREEVPTGQQYYDIEGATPITLTRGGSDSVSFGDIPAYFGIYDPNSSNVVNWYVRKVNSSGPTMGSGAFSADGNYTFYIIAGGEPENPNGKGYFTVIRTTDWSNGWGGMVFSTEMLSQLRDYFT